MSGPQLAANSIVKNIITYFATEIVREEQGIYTKLIPLYTKANTPGSVSGPTQFLINNTNTIAVFVGVVGVIVAGARLALQRRPTAAKQLTRGLVNSIIVTVGVSAGATGILLVLGGQNGVVDSYSSWIIQRAGGSGGPNQAAVIALLTKGMSTNNTTVVGSIVAAPFLEIIMGLVGILSGLGQLILSVIRLATMGLLIGLLPISAMASTTETGLAWFRKHILWLLAWLLWKPTAATLLAYGLYAMASPTLPNQEIALATFILALVALPVMMRLMNPLVTQATTSGDSGGGGAWGNAAAGALGVLLIR